MNRIEYEAAPRFTHRKRRIARGGYFLAMAALLLVVSSCSGGGKTSQPPDASRPKASPSPAAPPELAFDLPEPSNLKDLPGVESIEARPFADFMVHAFGRLWVGGVDKGVGVYDRTGKKLGSVEVEDPCMAMDQGFGAVWSGTCADRGIVRIDPKRMRVTGRADVQIAADGESSVAAGEGAVWAVSDAEGCTGCRLVRIDPFTMKVSGQYEIPQGSFAVRAGFGAVWITVPLENEVLRIDPTTGQLQEEIAVAAPGPRFLAVGEGGVWVLMTSDRGSVAHINPETNSVVASIGVDRGAIQGGDIAVGEGSVWARDTQQLVARIDPSSNRVTEWIGPPQGSGSVAAGDGNLWISAHDVFKLYRVPLNPS